MRELLQQALDMLMRPYSSKEESDQANILITKIQAELAKPEAEPVAWINGRLIFTDDQLSTPGIAVDFSKWKPLYTHPPKQQPLNEDDPVAWCAINSQGMALLRWDNDPHVGSLNWKPLHTHPPKQPLSDDEIIRIACGTNLFFLSDERKLIAISRAIEKAHGIG